MSAIGPRTMDEREIVAPVIDDFVRFAPSHACKHALPGQWMRSLNDPRMLTDRLPFGDDNQPIGIDMQADTAIGKAGGNAVAIAFERDQACG